RPGDAIIASITSTIPNLRAVVDVGRDEVVLRSQTVRLADGQAQVTIPYKAEFKGPVTIAAYADFADSPGMVSTRTVLYPHDEDLRIDAQPLAGSHRPGDEATIGFRVRGAKGGIASALGLAVVDKAVDERFRTDAEFGNQSIGFYGSIRDVLRGDDQIAGVTLRDLQRLDPFRLVSPDLQLVAEVLLEQNQNYRPVFLGGDSYDREQDRVFAAVTRAQIAPVERALATRYAKTGEYPNSESKLRLLLSDAGINLQAVRDPWG